MYEDDGNDTQKVSPAANPFLEQQPGAVFVNAQVFVLVLLVPGDPYTELFLRTGPVLLAG